MARTLVISLVLFAACEDSHALVTEYDSPGDSDDFWSEFEPSPDAPPPLFLSRDGRGSVASAREYYREILPAEASPADYPLTRWKAEAFGNRPLKTALYRNKTELGVWRQMACTEVVARGVGGCAVTHWLDPQDLERGVPNLGTLAMGLSTEGVAQFYVFSASGGLEPSVALDAEGRKFAPQLCTTCHAGQVRTGSDLGAIFRELEPSLLEPRPGITLEQAQAEWRALNQSIGSANANLRSEAEGALVGTDHAKAAVESYLAQMYSQQPSMALTIADLAHAPASWSAGANASEVSAKTELWRRLVNPYCMGCHRTNSVDFADYERWRAVAASAAGVPLLRRYLDFDPASGASAYPAMPQSLLGFKTLKADATAQSAANEWLALVGSSGALVANIAGAPATAKPGDALVLSADGSHDDLGGSLTFQWQIAAGPVALFIPSVTSSTVLFTVPEVTASTQWTVRLIVSSSRGEVAESLATVVFEPAAQAHFLVSAPDLPLEIPDDNLTGASSRIPVSQDLPLGAIKVSVDIDHGSTADLVVSLRGPNGLDVVLQDRQGNGAEGIHHTFEVTPSPGTRSLGTFRLKVVDTSSGGQGTLTAFKLDLGLTAP